MQVSRTSLVVLRSWGIWPLSSEHIMWTFDFFSLFPRCLNLLSQFPFLGHWATVALTDVYLSGILGGASSLLISATVAVVGKPIFWGLLSLILSSQPRLSVLVLGFAKSSFELLLIYIISLSHSLFPLPIHFFLILSGIIFSSGISLSFFYVLFHVWDLGNFVSVFEYIVVSSVPLPLQ